MIRRSRYKIIAFFRWISRKVALEYKRADDDIGELGTCVVICMEIEEQYNEVVFVSVNPSIIWMMQQEHYD